MGIQNYYGNLKEKFLTRLKRKEEEPAKPRAHPPRMHNLGEEIRLLVHSQSFEKAYSTAAPFLFASLGAWPGYWLFRGMDYHVHRSHIPLPIYIRQTYYQAKVVQLFIILAGTYTVFRNASRLRLMNANRVGPN
ncbi:uncharacterized protein LOC27206260 [Drosophila simulans]|uniref:GD13392 n=1 Tax=Drosophila simulans TaxID=7240 RepID=B4QNI1_DROSI|nr:uncharacterized protein LOC27206260 [Drosophila simulans]EDX08944.1 GD13392 [Drosophila simulans]KMY97113.1 uncharacterized protein Dsimw501_GD13392, isoform A [Drosophila simulans]KMY97114.1 uncharacterized protein Dsimw501_GD13392, isoform B [Drosophila simulans]